MAALFILSIMAIYLGKFLANRVDRRLITRVAAAVFVLIGLSLLLSATSSAFAEIL